jgi:hypothetical protein
MQKHDDNHRLVEAVDIAHVVSDSVAWKMCQRGTEVFFSFAYSDLAAGESECLRLFTV